MAISQDVDYLISKIGNVDPATKSKAVEIIRAANAAGHKVRFVWGMGGPPEHSTGRALDLMVYDHAAGEWIRNYIWANRARLKLKHVIWAQTITSTVVQPGVRRRMEDRGSPTNNHMDHNHVLFLEGAYTAPGAAPRPTTTTTTAKKPVTVIAQEVWAGKWGTGADRAARLKKAGYNPDQIQSLVNRGVGKAGVASDVNRKSNATIAAEVMAGKWGNGADRVARLTRAGYDAGAVQREVNKRAGGGSSAPNRKTVGQLAAEVIAGKWGNGPDRVNRLKRAGYDAAAVQREVNRLS